SCPRRRVRPRRPRASQPRTDVPASGTLALAADRPERPARLVAARPRLDPGLRERAGPALGRRPSTPIGSERCRSPSSTVLPLAGERAQGLLGGWRAGAPTLQ